MKLLFVICFACSCCFSCSKKNQVEVNIGPYKIKCNECNVNGNYSSDSYAGKMQYKKTLIYFDFGYYSPKLIESEKEFIDNEKWLLDMESFYSQNTTNNRPIKIDIIDIQYNNKKNSLDSNVDYIAKCFVNKAFVNWPIELPRQIKNHDTKTDTCYGFSRKIVYSKKNQEGICGIYIYNLKQFNSSINAYKALALYCKNPTHEDLLTMKTIIDSNFNCNSLRNLSFSYKAHGPGLLPFAADGVPKSYTSQL